MKLNVFNIPLNIRTPTPTHPHPHPHPHPPTPTPTHPPTHPPPPPPTHTHITHIQNPHKSTEATYVHHNSPFPHTVLPPGVTVTSVTSSQVVYETTAHSNATRVIAGYEVTRFGVPMIGEYVNTGRGRRVTISPAVPGAQYRITAWELGDGAWSDTTEVVNVITREASEFCRAFSNCTFYADLFQNDVTI